MANTVYTQLGFELATSALNLQAEEIRVALVGSTYVPDASHSVWDDVSAHEVSGVGYTSLGELVPLTAQRDDASARTLLTAPNITWSTSTITARYGIIFKNTGDSATSSLLLCVDLGAEQSSIEGNFIIQWTDGIVFTLS